jgi:hypothetical protein
MRPRSLAPHVLAIACLLACGGGEEECPLPPRTGPHTLTGWTIDTVQNAELRPPRDIGGSIDFVTGGDPAAGASKTFDCGSDGGNCNIMFSMAAPYQERDGESMTVSFHYGANQRRDITFRRQGGSTENPVHISLPSCGEITVEVSVDGGPNGQIDNTFSAGPFYFECRDCAITERGGQGT